MRPIVKFAVSASILAASCKANIQVTSSSPSEKNFKNDENIPPEITDQKISVSLDKNTLSATWTPATTNNSDKSALEYLLCQSTKLEFVATIEKCLESAGSNNWMAGVTSLPKLKLKPATTYYINVVVRDKFENLSIYTPIRIDTAIDTLPPSVGTILASTRITPRTATLNWTAASDDIDDDQDIQYLVCWSTNQDTVDSLNGCESSTNKVDWTRDIQSISIAGLTQSTTYFFNILAKDTSGNIAKSTRSSITTATDIPPTISIESPIGNDDSAAIGSSVSVGWTAIDPDDVLTIKIYVSQSTGSTCSSGTLVGTGSNVSPGSSSLTIDTSSFLDGFYYFCAIANDGTNPDVASGYSGRLVVYPIATCTWVGDTSTGWSTSSNWIGCPGGVAPTSSDSVLILPNGVNQPVLTANTTIVGFGSGRGRGQVTINAGVSLTMSSTGVDIESDVTIKGDTSTCATCKVTSPDLVIGNFATLTLGSGIRAAVSGGFYVGSSTTNGNLITLGGATEAEWPVITAIGSSYNYFAIQGVSPNRSSVDINGLVAEKFSVTYYNDIEFRGNFEIKRLDNFSIYGQTISSFQGSSRIAFTNCTNSIVTDTNWIGINFNVFSQTHIAASSCTIASSLNPGFTAITVSGGGFNFASLEADSGNIINWSITRNTCVWNTSGPDRNWHNGANWSSCGSTYPGGNDLVDIGAGGNQPQVSTHAAIWGFSGAGGGTVEIMGAYVFSINSSSFSSSIKFIGPTGTGTYAVIKNTGANISGGGSLTLGPAMGLETNGYIVGLNIGSNGGGTFATQGGADPGEWPYINLAVTSTTTGSVSVNGAAGNLAKINIDGLIHHRVRSGWTFSDYYQIDKFDNIIAYSEYGTYSGFVNLSTCTGSTINDATWTNWTFRDPFGASYNMINATSSTCSAALFAVSYDVAGPGPFTTADTYSMFTAIAKTCTGANNNNFCWHLGAAGNSCDTVCTGNGGITPGHLIVTGKAGSLANCQNIFGILGASGGPTATNNSAGGAYGCVRNGSSWQRYSTNGTSSSASNGSLERVCSCAQ